MPLDLGHPVPDLTLRDQHGRSVTLAELRGQPVLVMFYPFAFSPVCSGELRALRDALPAFGAASGAVLAVFAEQPHCFLLRRQDPVGLRSRDVSLAAVEAGCGQPHRFGGPSRWS